MALEVLNKTKQDLIGVEQKERAPFWEARCKLF